MIYGAHEQQVYYIQQEVERHNFLCCHIFGDMNMKPSQADIHRPNLGCEGSLTCWRWAGPSWCTTKVYFEPLLENQFRAQNSCAATSPGETELMVHRCENINNLAVMFFRLRVGSFCQKSFLCR